MNRCAAIYEICPRQESDFVVVRIVMSRPSHVSRTDLEAAIVDHLSHVHLLECLHTVSHDEEREEKTMSVALRVNNDFVSIRDVARTFTRHSPPLSSGSILSAVLPTAHVSSGRWIFAAPFTLGSSVYAGETRGVGTIELELALLNVTSCVARFRVPGEIIHDHAEGACFRVESAEVMVAPDFDANPGCPHLEHGPEFDYKFDFEPCSITYRVRGTVSCRSPPLSPPSS